MDRKTAVRKRFEHYCAMCRRPESIAGKMVEMPNHMYVCPDCMQRMFDLMHSSGFPYQNMMNVTNMEDLMNLLSQMGIPGITLEVTPSRWLHRKKNPEKNRKKRQKKQRENRMRQPMRQLAGRGDRRRPGGHR